MVYKSLCWGWEGTLDVAVEPVAVESVAVSVLASNQEPYLVTPSPFKKRFRLPFFRMP